MMKKKVRAVQYLNWDESHEELEAFVRPIFIPPTVNKNVIIIPIKRPIAPLPFPRFARAGSLTLNPDVTAFLWCYPEDDWRGLIDGDWVVEIPEVGYTSVPSGVFDTAYAILED